MRKHKKRKVSQVNGIMKCLHVSLFTGHGFLKKETKLQLRKKEEEKSWRRRRRRKVLTNFYPFDDNINPFTLLFLDYIIRITKNEEI